MNRPRFLALLLASIVGCGASPARFADRPVVEVVPDGEPIAVPQRTRQHDLADLREAAVERAAVGALDAARTTDAGDVNALDEVPRSSWFEPSGAQPTPGQPAKPLTVLDEPAVSGTRWVAVRDAWGRRWEILADPDGRRGLWTGAAVIATRLFRSLGYLVAPITLETLAPGDVVVPKDEPPGGPAIALIGRGWIRVAVVQSPGIDLGPTSLSGRRTDDPSDRLPHPQRRSLRALGVISSWLAIRLDPNQLRDVYVGAPGRGHVEHLVFGLEGALGAAAATAPRADAERVSDRSALTDLATLGLLPDRHRGARFSRWLSTGEVDEQVLRSDFAPAASLHPIEEAKAADRYWAAKRIAGIPRDTITAAVEAAQLQDPAAAAWLNQVLERRRATVVGTGFAGVTPCEVASVGKDHIVLRDQLVAWLDAGAPPARYRIELIDAEGETVAKSFEIDGRGAADVVVPLAASALATDYLVIRVLSRHAGETAPREMEAHLVRGRLGPRLLGVRH